MKKCLEIHQQLNLQCCIKALFLNADSKRLASDFKNHRFEVSEDYLVRLLRHECSRYTLDQIRAVAKMFSTHWSRPGATDENVHYATKPTIFNMLLHFVDGGMLHLENDTPVCHWEGLLRWHTLTTDIGEDILVCAYLAGHDIVVPPSHPRKNFNWNPCLRTDDASLNLLLELPLADIHSHLKGSSLNFDINWICLMNMIDRREKIFKKLKEKVQSSHLSEKGIGEGLYKKAVLAAAIRLYLLELVRGKESSHSDILMKLLDDINETDVISEASKLQSKIENTRQSIGKQYKSMKDGQTAIFDYAIINGVSVEKVDALTLLSGERYLLYSLLSNIYKGANEGPKTDSLLYLYLVIKNEIRHELTQLNDSVGFDNFNIYENRKLLFVKEHKEYENAAIHLALKGFFGDYDGGSRYHEVRITPENSGGEIVQSIQKLDHAIESDLLKQDDTQWNYRYIFHFIKKPDDLKSVECRHYGLRKEVKEQSLAIYKYRNSLIQCHDGTYLADRAVGIDAANSEIACRPEVFAQAFRFLRHHSIENDNIHRPHDLGVTFHVGEDYMDVVDGLRAVSEAISFLQLRKGDRIGHGLVLGVDVKEYYKSRNYTIAMSLQMMVDNMAWLHHRVKGLKGFGYILGGIKETFEDCYRKVYSGSIVPSIELYYKSMLLRGDAPECYKEDGTVNNMGDDLVEWKSKALNSDILCSKAREYREARKLFYQYHYCQKGKQNGAIYNEWVVDDGIISAIAEIQQQILDEVEEIGLAIECNPTSNLRIGEFDRYDEHPILKFNNDGLRVFPKQSLSVSINTDDKGVFSTSIEREYALIAYAIMRYFKLNGYEISNTEVYDWLDRIRLNSLSQRFDRSCSVIDSPKMDTIAKFREQCIKEIEKDKSPNNTWWLRIKQLWKRSFETLYCGISQIAVIVGIIADFSD